MDLATVEKWLGPYLNYEPEASDKGLLVTSGESSRKAS
jgi:hypothetical protein